jgi:hypothetical protein
MQVSLARRWLDWVEERGFCVVQSIILVVEAHQILARTLYLSLDTHKRR